jgi:putative flippase GtrA
VAFGMIGVGNALLYFAIFNLTIGDGRGQGDGQSRPAITTTLAYVAHRYWTYRGRSKSAVRREYVLFVGFNDRRHAHPERRHRASASTGSV